MYSPHTNKEIVDRLPSYQGACPRKSAAKGSKTNDIIILYFPIFPSLAQGNRYGGCCSIAVFVNIIIDLVIPQF